MARHRLPWQDSARATAGGRRNLSSLAREQSTARLRKHKTVGFTGPEAGVCGACSAGDRRPKNVPLANQICFYPNLGTCSFGINGLSQSLPGRIKGPKSVPRRGKNTHRRGPFEGSPGRADSPPTAP